ncbi:hypothetical protein ACFVQB_23155 [Paenibacillus sp. NPDC057886]|uniref:hypothetical protein n=1 Tax=Paenibacillus sp. NPDC057886 TaxID=3346270 RepID=UPI0036D1C74A
MNSTHILILFILLLFLFLSLNEIIKFIARKDKESPPPINVRLWLIPLLSLLIIVPVAFFTILYSLFFYTFGGMSNSLYFEQIGDGIIFSVFILIGFILFETLIHPIIIAALNYGVQRRVSVYTRNSVTIIIDGIIIYFLGSIFEGVYIQDFWSALSISVLYHIIEWLFTWIHHLYKKRKNNMTL